MFLCVFYLDGIINKGTTTVDNSALTGEAVPVFVKEGDEVLSGSLNLTSTIEIQVNRLYSDSTISRIIEMVEHATSRKAKTEKFITKFSRYYTPIVVFLALLIGVVLPLILKVEFKIWFERALIFLVISCPCALVISIPLTFFAGIGGASKEGILIKGSNYLETLSKTKYVVFDKTGTLTEGVFKVNAVHHSKIDENKLIEYAALAECASTHPISKSLISAYGKVVDRKRVSDVQEISGNGITAKVDGEQIAVGNDKLMKYLNIKYIDCHSTGTIIHIAINNKYMGHIVISDVIKPNSANAIKELKKVGITKTIMLTGDKKCVAQSVAETLNLDEYHSELLPEDKVKNVEILLNEKPKNSKLAFVGDGINDAPVLSRADIGIAMGAMGSDAAIEAADIVLMDDDPLKIAKAIKNSKNCLGIVYQNIILAIGIKALCLILGALGIANMWFAIFADVGVMIIAVINAIRALYTK